MVPTKRLVLALAAIAAAAGCSTEADIESDSLDLLGDVISLEDLLDGVTGWSDATASTVELGQLTPHQRRGRRLFNEATFDGNGRTCRSCHPSGADESGQLLLADIQARFASDPDDPLFQHDAADLGSVDTFDRLRSQGTIQVTLPLPSNVSIVGSSARTVTVLRAVPTTMNVGALDPLLMWDGRAPTLQAQAAGAITGHAQSTSFSASQLDAIADFETTLFDRNGLRAYADGGAPPALPLGTTPLEILGRTFFTPDGPTSKCGWCHSGPMLDETSPFFELLNVVTGGPPVPAGTRFQDLALDQFNDPGNPVYTFRFQNPDGTTTDFVSADPGRALITGQIEDAGDFKIQTLWGARDTAPYFHDNSSKTLEDLVSAYDRIFDHATNGLVRLNAAEQAAVLAYLKLL